MHSLSLQAGRHSNAFECLLQKSKPLVLLWEALWVVACCLGLNFQFLSRAAVQSLWAEIRGGICTLWTVFSARQVVRSLPVEKGVEATASVCKSDHTLLHLTSLVQRTLTVSCDIFKVSLKSKYAIVMALFLTTEPVAGPCGNVFSFYVLMVFMNWESLIGLQFSPCVPAFFHAWKTDCISLFQSFVTCHALKGNVS